MVEKELTYSGGPWHNGEMTPCHLLRTLMRGHWSQSVLSFYRLKIFKPFLLPSLNCDSATGELVIGLLDRRKENEKNNTNI